MCTANFSTRISALYLRRPFIYSPYQVAGNCVSFPIQHAPFCLPNGSSRCSLWGSEPPSPKPDPCPPLPGPSSRPVPCPGPIASCPFCELRHQLTLILLTWRIWWAPNNASKWQVGFNSAFKGLILKCDHVPQEGLDINTDLTVTLTDRQIMIFVHTFVSVWSVPVDLTANRQTIPSL